MSADFVLAAATLGIAALVVAALLRRYAQVALWATGILALVFPLISDTSDWDSWFDWVKRYSVVIPTFFWAFLHARPAHRLSGFLARALPFVLILNVLEAGLLDLLGTECANGILILLIAACVPLTWTRAGSGQQLGFREPLWQIAYMLTLSRLYVLNPTFENSTAGLLLILALASLLCLCERDSHGYVAWRVFTLYVFVLQDSLFPSLSDYLYPTWLHKEVRVQLQGTWLAHGWLALNIVVVLALVVRRVRALRKTTSTAAA